MKTILLRSLALASVLLMALVVSGCATGHIGQVVDPITGEELGKDDAVFVKDFDAQNTVFMGDYSDVPERVAEQRERLPKLISQELVAYLTKHGYTAELYSDKAQGDAVVVDGELTLVDAGSAAARFWVGMGSGMSGVHSNVKVYEANGRPLAELKDVSGTSGGAGGFSGYQDWIAANAKDLAEKLGEFLIGKADK